MGLIGHRRWRRAGFRCRLSSNELLRKRQLGPLKTHKVGKRYLASAALCLFLACLSA